MIGQSGRAAALDRDQVRLKLGRLPRGEVGRYGEIWGDQVRLKLGCLPHRPVERLRHLHRQRDRE